MHYKQARLMDESTMSAQPKTLLGCIKNSHNLLLMGHFYVAISVMQKPQLMTDIGIELYKFYFQ